MKKELLNYINCPICQGSSFAIKEDENNDGVIKEGKIICLKCNNIYKISKGIIYLFEKISDIALKEKESHEQEIINDKKISNFQDENWVLNYPHVAQMGIDDRSERTGKLISENTELSLKKFITKDNSVILEIGAGKCWVMSMLAKNNYCIALDILTMMPIGLEAGEIYIKNKNIFFERVSADMIKLPFKDQIFDYVIISSSLHHSPDLDKTLSEVKRVLKSNGQFVLLNEPYQGLLGSQERARAEADFKSGLNEKRYTIKNWNKYFSSSGFKIKIFLPENLLSILKTKGWIFKKIALFLSFPLFFKIFVPPFKLIIFQLFDGYFNAVLQKEK
jgi:SAM-dependent methyltransferase